MSLLKTLSIAALLSVVSLGFAKPSQAALITFDEVVIGETSFSFDGDSDGIADILFSTTDPFGFNTTGPGPNQVFVDEPGLEGTSLLNPDLRVDFLNGAVDVIQFGFALNSFSEGADTFTTFNLFNSSGTLLASVQEFGRFSGPAGFPEGQIQVSFPGVAAYGTFDFSSASGRYIIDNFEGTLGSTENVTPVPEPFTGFALVFTVGLGGLLQRKRR